MSCPVENAEKSLNPPPVLPPVLPLVLPPVLPPPPHLMYI